MSHLRNSLVTLVTVIVSACSSAPVTTSSVASDITNEGENTDIQLIAVNAIGNVTSSLAWNDCSISDKSPLGAGRFEARADCTDAASTAMNLPLINRYVEPLLWIYENSSSTTYASRHWCMETRLVVAVKEAALNSPNFREIGFYSYDALMNSGNNGTIVTYAKDDWRLQRHGEAHLKSGEKVVLFKFGGAGPCAVNGTGDNPGGRLMFKPFVTYDGGLRRWESVSGNHGIGYGEHIYRGSDLLRD